MEKVNRRYGFRIIILIYFLFYLIAILNHQFIWTSLLKPGATLLVCYGLYKVIEVKQIYIKATDTIRRAFALWFIVDILSTTAEIYFHYKSYDFTMLYVIEAFLYLSVRAILLISSIQFYMGLTAQYNKFQRFADIFTITCCVISTLWIIFFAKDTAESVSRMLSLDLVRIFSEIYRLLSMLILGIYLISWFHYQNYRITLGQRHMLAGLASVAGMDLAIAFYNPLIDKISTDIIYKLAILLVAAGCEMYLVHPQKTLFIKPKNEEESLSTAWKNIFYLFSYPIFTVAIVGVRAELVIYVFLFAFYIIACLYTKQLNIVDIMLTKEKERNNQLMLYSKVIEQSPLSVVITDIDGTIQYVNPYFTQTTGYEFEEAVGKNPRILKSDQKSKEFYEELWGDITHGRTWVGEFVNIDKQGNKFQERAVISPIAGEDGNIAYFVGIKENITEEQKMKNTLKDQGQFIVQFADFIPNSIFQVDSNDRFVGANAEFCRIYQIDSSKYRGVKCEDMPWMNAEKYKIFVKMREESMRMKRPVVRQIVTDANGLQTPVLYCVNTFYKSDGTVAGYIGMMTDISELKAKELELQNALIMANAATEAKSMFLANMSHEIRTPMNVVIGMSYLALKTELTIKQRDYIQKINSAATSLLGIINDILDFSKIESGKMRMEKLDINLDQVISKAIELLVPKAREKNLEFIYHLDVDIPQQLIGDPLRLGQVITNLVSNAVKFTPTGEIRVNVDLEKQVDQFVCLKFSIADTGIGISKEKQDILFEAFTQSDNTITRQYGGTGLGLVICRNLVGMMGGELWVDSEESKGSTFYFTAWFETVETANQREKVKLQDMKQIKTLIVDDNYTAREIMKEYMQYIGICADVAESGNQAIEMIQKEAENKPYQLLIIDWKMPDLDGVETVKQLNALEALKNKPTVVFVTAYDTEDMKKHMDDLEVAAFLEKPVSQSCLYDAIVNIYADSFPIGLESMVPQEEYCLEGVRILIVEDNEVNQQIACELLASQGCVFEVVNNGNEAVNILLNSKKQFDLVLMDIQMPEMDGFEATKILREMKIELPIVAMTARSMQDEKEKCYKVGMNDHIAKPIDPKILMAVVSKWSMRNVKNREPQTIDVNNRI